MWDLIRTVPYCNKIIATISCILNIILPGIGTIVAACAGSGVIQKTQVLIGVLQFLTAYILIGLFWSWYWAYLIVIRAWGRDRDSPSNPIGGPLTNGSGGSSYAIPQRSGVGELRGGAG